MRKAAATITGLFILPIVLMAAAGCSESVDKAVVEPVQRTVRQQDKAALEAALANARSLQQALFRYSAASEGNLYPTSMDVFGYEDLRKVLADAAFPPDMSDLQWDPGAGFTFSSDGKSYEVRVRALTLRGENIVVTPHGVLVE